MSTAEFRQYLFPQGHPRIEDVKGSMPTPTARRPAKREPSPVNWSRAGHLST
jgi:hypothetical protein